ncbi:MBL fold metallo-hydrolase [Cyanobacterium stanieri LEGE 03274]|uniref:MBL fold metallo-hydrolase n=1 Tax=Cyanobacterium stanieri LEGE 03274 TaxID=1828756 RepID=A0ABR9V686_9CHRO|nr:MBL fold metallo-hydrolase [Cyanobacterium stanieri]MBE9223407.1 MBL fold metallo-hydrolase [Cyanobacterium stanieri LEGE 03274]
MQLTWFDSNSWLIEIGDKRILLDPWLVGSLTFGNLDWLFEGKKRNPQPIPSNIDFILLSQGLEDHAHPPTLKELDHNIKVIASPNASKVCQELGYQTIITLNHGESHIIDDTIEIKAVKGSPVGPTLVENGYIIKDLTNGDSIYYEPHGFHSQNLQTETGIKAIITPLTSIKIPLIGPVIKGQKNALEVCQWLKPEYILPTAAGGDIEFKGFLINLLKEEGSLDNFRSMLTGANLSTQVIEPKPYETVKLS